MILVVRRIQMLRNLGIHEAPDKILAGERSGSFKQTALDIT